jgi:hypothetical protein
VVKGYRKKDGLTAHGTGPRQKVGRVKIEGEKVER